VRKRDLAVEISPNRLKNCAREILSVRVRKSRGRSHRVPVRAREESLTSLGALTLFFSSFPPSFPQSLAHSNAHI
jgi:hypothetical protein